MWYASAVLACGVHRPDRSQTLSDSKSTGSGQGTGGDGLCIGTAVNGHLHMELRACLVSVRGIRFSRTFLAASGPSVAASEAVVVYRIGDRCDRWACVVEFQTTGGGPRTGRHGSIGAAAGDRRTTFGTGCGCDPSCIQRLRQAVVVGGLATLSTSGAGDHVGWIPRRPARCWQAVEYLPPGQGAATADTAALDSHWLGYGGVGIVAALATGGRIASSDITGGWAAGPHFCRNRLLVPTSECVVDPRGAAGPARAAPRPADRGRAPAIRLSGVHCQGGRIRRPLAALEPWEHSRDGRHVPLLACSGSSALWRASCGESPALRPGIGPADRERRINHFRRQAHGRQGTGL